MSRRLFSALIARRGMVFAGTLLWLLPVTWLALTVRLDFDVERYFPDGDRAMAQFKEFKHRFASQDGAISLLWHEEGGVTRASLMHMKQVATLFEKAGLTRVTWAGSLQAGRKKFTIQKFMNEEPRGGFYEGILYTPDKKSLIITGWLPKAENTDAGRKKMERTLTRVLENHTAMGRTLILSGEPIIRARYLNMMARDQVVLIGGGLLLTFALLLLFLGSLPRALLPLAAVIPAYLTVMALMALFHRPVTAVISMVPVILLLVGVSDTIHILIPYGDAKNDLSKKQHIINVFSHVARPCLFTSGVTALSFLTLTASGISVITDFALATALGIMLTFGFSMLLYPGLLSLLPKPSPRKQSLISRHLVPLFARFTLKKALVTLTIVAASASLFALFARDAAMESFILNDLRPSSPLYKDLRAIEATGTGIFQVNIYFPGETSPPTGSLFDRNTLLKERALKYPFVTKVVTLNDAVAEGLRDAPIPFTPDLFHQIGPKILQKQLATHAKNPNTGLRSLYDPATKSSQIMIFVKDVGSKKMNHFLSDMSKFIAAQQWKSPPRITGTVSLTQQTYDRLFSGFILSLGIAVLVIFGMLWLVGRSLVLALMALIPNFFPLLALMGIIGMTRYTLSPASLLVFTVAFGLCVDDTVHLLSRLATARATMRDPASQLASVLSLSGRAVLITSLVIATGFMVMLLSNFQTIFDMGFLVPTALLFALPGDLMLLPALYLTAHRLHLIR